ncbi:glycosyltransferase [Jannaschia sp.]|nr:glycosyltransferase [Jannaschia sp.]
MQQDTGRSVQPSDHQILLTEDIRIEWQPDPKAIPVQVSTVEVDGHAGHLIKTLPGSGWVRLYVPLEAPEIGILASRFLLKVDQNANLAKIKPRLVKTNLQTDARRPFPIMLGRTFELTCGKWHEIVSAYLHTNFVGRFQPGITIDIPRAAEIVLLDVSLKRLPVPLSNETKAALLADDIHPLAQFAVRPVEHLTRCLESPTVYATSLSVTRSQLSGWMISDTDQLFWREAQSGRSGAFTLDTTALVPGDAHFTGGVTVDFETPLAQTSILQVTTSQTDPTPVWAGMLTDPEGDAAAIGTLFDIKTAQVVNGLLTVEGDVQHPLYPGMPVRLNLMREADIVASTIAHIPAPSTTYLDHETAFHFSLSVPLRPSETEKTFWLGFSGVAYDARLHVKFTRDEGRVQARKLDMDVPALPAGGMIKGQVDGQKDDVVTGWAVCPQESDSAIEVILYPDEVPFAYSKTQMYRSDIQDIYGNQGFNGFQIDLPPNMAVLREIDMKLRPVGRSELLRKGHIRSALPPGISAPALLPALRAWTPTSGAAPEEAGRISVIVLNLDGADLLDEMFASCLPEDLSGQIEWIVVDHSSTDDSRGVCERHAAKGADIRFLFRRGNYSFSESNNYGVEHATGDILLFANNDLIFEQGFGARLRDYMRDPEIGALGVRLVDHIDDPRHKDLKIDQHLGVFFERRTMGKNWIRPYEARACEETDATAQATRCIAVTGAFLAMRRSDFEAVDGFDESYSYGLEDVDLCLKVHTILDRAVVCANDIEVIHHRGFSRKKSSETGLRRRRNNEIFTKLWGGTLRRMIKTTGLTDPGHVTGMRPVFAFMVADVGDTTPAGEYYTSLEMGRALQKILPCHIRYVPESDWYDLSGIDVVVAMVNRFDIAKGKGASPWLVTVNWMRQWFDRWAEDASLFGYDFLFASSAPACEMLEARTGRPVHLLPIASSYHDFAEATPKEELRCDYAFTGSRFGPPREIEFQLDPARVEGQGKVFGHNWDDTPFGDLSQGPVAYSEIPHVYASTRIVLDDANIATKPWGSCNSRVFDAMASGALLVSNGVLGCRELFGDLVPTFHDADSLTETLNHWLANEPARAARVAEMQEVIRTKHTYDVRARDFLAKLTADVPVRIAIKCGALYNERQQWGDYHYAQSLAASLRRLGFVARVDCRESWETGLSDSDDVVIALRGLLRYKPKRHQTNLLWLISHPNDISIAELEEFDHSYVASQYHADSLERLLPGRVDFMPQCTDMTRFFFDPEETNSCPERNLYVANSRGIFRNPVRWAIQGELNLDIYGVGWEPFITDERFKGGVISNQVLGGFYASSRLVICDHWEDMKSLGYVSNRVFDVLGAGGRLAVDSVRGLGDLVPLEYLDRFETYEEFAAILKGPDRVDLEARREISDWVKRNHSFDARADVFARKIRAMMGALYDRDGDAAR